MNQVLQAPPKCEKCGGEKYWYVTPSRGTGQWCCRQCQAERAKAYREKNLEKCKASSRAASKQRYYRDLETSRAKSRDCARAYRAKPGNREKAIERTKRWRSENQQYVLDYSREYHDNHRDQIAEKQSLRLKTDPDYAEKRRNWTREWQESNRDKARAATKRWKDQNPESTRQLGVLRRAREHNAIVSDRPVTAKVQKERKALFGGCCFCGSQKKLTLEHIVPLSKGGLHVEENLLGSCKPCNSSKHVKPIESWYRAQPFFDEQRWQQIKEVTLLSDKDQDQDVGTTS